MTQVVQVHQVMQQIKLSDWDDGIADLSNWRFVKLDRYSRGHDETIAPTTLFILKGELRLLGFEKVGAIWKVDERDLQREDIACHDDPEEAYINYVKLNFGIYLSGVKDAITKYKMHQMGLYKPEVKPIFPDAVDYRQESKQNDFRNKLHDRKKVLRKMGRIK